MSKIDKKYVLGISLGVVASLGLLTLLGSVPKETPVASITVNKFEPAPNSQVDVKGGKSVVVDRITVSPEQVIYINTEITEMTVATVIAQLIEREKTGKDIYLLIDSPGGSVLDGAQIISFMESSKVPVHTVCTKLCASMAAIIHQYGKTRLAFDRSILMFHPASGGARGQVENMRSILNMISRLTKKFDAFIVARSKMSEPMYNNLVAYELWLDGEDSINLGFVDKLVSIRIE